MVYVLDASAQNVWRTSPTSVTADWLFLHQPEVVFKARAVDTGIIPYPMFVIVFDGVTVGAYTDLEEDMIMLLGTTDGADDLGRVRIHKAANGVVATSVTINFQYSSQGILDGEINLQEDAYITVLNYFPIWSIPPLITSGGTIFKDTDKAFDVDTHLKPVANAGIDRLFVVENIGDDVTFNPAEFVSYVTKPGAVITDYLWTTPDAQTSTSADPTFTIEADTVGYMKLEVTDDEGNVTTSRRFLAVVNKDHANLFRNFEITQHSAGFGGQQMSIRVHDSIPFNTYIAGAEALLTMRERYGTTVGSLVGVEDSESMLFAGFTADENMSGEWSPRGYLHQTTLTLHDTGSRMRVLPGFTQLIERETDPENWGQMQGANLDRYVWHLGYWHSNVMRRADFMWSGTADTYGFQVLGSDGGSLFDQMTLRARAIRHELTCDRFGRLQMIPDPQLQAEADRSSDVIVPLVESDWQSLSRNYNFHPRHHWQFGEKIVASTVDASSGAEINTVFTLAPGLAPGVGLASLVAGEELVINQTEANQVDGARYRARTNARESTYDVLLSRLGYAVDVALLKWVRFEVTSVTAGVRGRTVASTSRFLPTEIQYQWDHRNAVRRQRWTIEREGTQVIDAVTDLKPIDPGFTIPDLPIYGTPDYVPAFALNTISSNVQNFVVFMMKTQSTGAGAFWTTADFQSVNPTWVETTLASLSITGRYIDAQQNPSLLTQWIVFTTTGSWTIDDVWGTPTLSDSDTMGILAGDVVNLEPSGYIVPRIHTHISALGFVVAQWWNTNAGTPSRDGHHIRYSTDFGASGSWGGGEISNNLPCGGLYVSSHQPGVFFGSDVSAGTGRLLRFDNYGADAPSVLATHTGGAISFQIPHHNNTDDGIILISHYNGSDGTRVSLYDHGTITTETPFLQGGEDCGFANLGADFASTDRNRIRGWANRYRADGSFFTANSVPGGYTESDDGAQTWSGAAGAGQVYDVIAIAGDNHNVLFAAGRGGAMSISVDDGANWVDKGGSTLPTGTGGDAQINRFGASG